MNPILEAGLRLGAYLLVALVLLAAYRLFLNYRPGGYHDLKQLHVGNTAAMWHRGGRYVGLLIAMCGSNLGESEGLSRDLALFAINGVITVAIFIVLVFMLDFAILWRIDNTQQVKDGNMAVAVVETFASLAMGFIVLGSFSGEGASFGTGILSALAFSVIGLATLAMLYWLYELVTRWSVEGELAGGNVAAGFEVGSFLLAMGVVLMFSIRGDFTGWVNDLVSYGVAALAGTVLVMVARVTVARWLLPDQSLLRHHAHHASMGVSVLLGFISVGLVTILGTSL